jgi:MscS family membrane protein
LLENIEAYLNVYNYVPFSKETLLIWTIRTGIALIIFSIFWLLRKYFTQIILRYLSKILEKTKIKLDEYLALSLEKPLRIFFVALGIYLALIYLPLSSKNDLLLIRIFRSLLIVLVSLCFCNLTGNYIALSEELEKWFNIHIDKILIPFFSNIIKVVVIALALSIILQEWDYDINGFIAGLGLGGLAFALAAQNTLANIFGGIVIITDKPFSIGDWINTPSVEGTVEDINFRSTKVRTFAQAIVTVPNSTLANEAITNWSRMGKRRITFHLGVTYDTTKPRLEKCLSEIRMMLFNHPGINKDTIVVRFDSFGDSSLDILMYFFTETTNWDEYLEVKEDVNFRIMEILNKEKIAVAFPSTSVYFENQLDTNNRSDMSQINSCSKSD